MSNWKECEFLLEDIYIQDSWQKQDACAKTREGRYYCDCEKEKCKSVTKKTIEYPSVDKVYQIANNYLIGVDQSNSEDKTCLCFCKVKEGKFHIERFQHIEKQEDMDKYINMNTAKWLDEWSKGFVHPLSNLKEQISKSCINWNLIEESKNILLEKLKERNK